MILPLSSCHLPSVCRCLCRVVVGLSLQVAEEAAVRVAVTSPSWHLSSPCLQLELQQPTSLELAMLPCLAEIEGAVAHVYLIRVAGRTEE